MDPETHSITTLFLDIGGVLLTNGWDRQARRRAAEKFQMDHEEFDERHHLTFDTYEEGKLSLDEYLNRVVFFEERAFSREAFKTFMFSRSQPFEDMLALMRTLKARYGLKIVAVSNEGRELTLHRIEKFNLREIFDAFVCSCFVHFRKPDADLFRMALDVSQSPAEETVYIDDRLMFVQVAASLGIGGIHHTRYDTTRLALERLGIEAD